MRVIMLSDVKGIGKKGQIVEVKDGYAANFLIPKGFAVKETPKSKEILANQNAAKEAARLSAFQEASLIAKRLESVVCEFEANTGSDGKMFGTISYKQIEQHLKEKFDITIDKRKIIDRIPVDRIGYTNLQIELFKGVIGTITVHVSEKK